MKAVRIVTDYEFPPIPIRQFDWSAVTDDYEPGHPIGRGPTEEAAVADLREQVCSVCDQTPMCRVCRYGYEVRNG